MSSTAHVADLADDYVHGLLDRAAASRVEAHCAACAACRAALDAARARQLRAAVVKKTPGEPIPNVPVKVELRSRSTGQTVELASLNTDALGVAEPRFAVPDWPEPEADLFITAQTAQGAEKSQHTVA